MNPYPLALLNHLTLPVIRIVLCPTCYSRSWCAASPTDPRCPGRGAQKKPAGGALTREARQRQGDDRRELSRLSSYCERGTSERLAALDCAITLGRPRLPGRRARSARHERAATSRLR